jgi:hypothetical protein
MRWVRRGGALGALLVGWLFIAWQNRFHVTAPLVFVCLAYLAVIATVLNLWRTGAAAVATPEGEADSTWAKPAGALGELEREKRTLLKAIKEAEFDHEMGKLSKHDADAMVVTYRARAIEVIKEIDRLGTGKTGTPREQIMREVRARLELEARSQKKPGKAEPAAKAESNGKASRAKKKQAPAEVVASGELAAGTEPAVSDALMAGETAPPVTAAQAKAEAAQAKAEAAAQAADQAAIDDDALNADSTTSVEPRRDPTKEATP